MSISKFVGAIAVFSFIILPSLVQAQTVSSSGSEIWNEETPVEVKEQIENIEEGSVSCMFSDKTYAIVRWRKPLPSDPSSYKINIGSKVITILNYDHVRLEEFKNSDKNLYRFLSKTQPPNCNE